MNRKPNHRAGADAGFALVFAFARHWPGTAQHDRYANMRPIKAPSRWASYGGIVAALLVGVLRAQDFTYTNSNGTITITGYIGPGGNVTIPASIEGLAVTAIG